LDRKLRDAGDVRELSTAKGKGIQSQQTGLKLQDQGGRDFVGMVLG